MRIASHVSRMEDCGGMLRNDEMAENVPSVSKTEHTTPNGSSNCGCHNIRIRSGTMRSNGCARSSVIVVSIHPIKPVLIMMNAIALQQDKRRGVVCLVDCIHPLHLPRKRGQMFWTLSVLKIDLQAKMPCLPTQREPAQKWAHTPSCGVKIPKTLVFEADPTFGRVEGNLARSASSIGIFRIAS